MRLPGIAGVEDLNTKTRDRPPDGAAEGASDEKLVVALERQVVLTPCVPLQLPRAWGATCPRNAVEPMWLMEHSSGWLYREVWVLLPGYSKDPYHISGESLGRESVWVRAGNDACASKWRQAGSQRALLGLIRAPRNLIETQRLDQPRLGRRQQLRQHSEVRAASSADLQRYAHVDPDHVSARREPQLALAREQHLPRLVLLPADQGVLAVGAEPAVGSGLAAGAGQAAVAAGSAVLGPSTRLEMPAAEDPDPFFAAFSNTWRSVNSWKNRSPTG
jgi:hypothetical protein